jgi:uncharacterized protein (DUF427 family)
MYLLASTEQRKMLFESTQEMNDYLKLNNLENDVLEIREIDKAEYNDILRKTVKKIKRA